MPSQKPGEKPVRPGEYVEVGPGGRPIPRPHQVTIEPGDPKLPPTQKPGNVWKPPPPRVPRRA